MGLRWCSAWWELGHPKKQKVAPLSLPALWPHPPQPSPPRKSPPPLSTFNKPSTPAPASEASSLSPVPQERGTMETYLKLLPTKSQYCTWSGLQNLLGKVPGEWPGESAHKCSRGCSSKPNRKMADLRARSRSWGTSLN